MTVRLFTGLALALTLAVSANAATSPMQLPAAGGTLDLQSQPEQVGDHWRFLTVSEDVNTGSKPSQQSNRRTFDVEVIGRSAEALTLRYTLREVAITDTRAGIEAQTKAWIGIPIEFEARQGYQPYRLTNWPQIRKAYLEALERAQADPRLLKSVEGYMDQMEAGDQEDMARQLLGDIITLAGMQQAAAPRVRMDFPAQTRDLGQGRTMLITGWLGLDSEDAGKCQATWSRDTRRQATVDGVAFDRDLTTTATLSTRDGWVLSLKETEVTTFGGDTERKTLTLTRVGAAPACA